MMDHDHVHQSLLDTRPRVKSRLAFKKIKQGTDPQELEIRANQNGKFSLNVAIPRVVRKSNLIVC